MKKFLSILVRFISIFMVIPVLLLESKDIKTALVIIQFICLFLCFIIPLKWAFGEE